MSSPTSTTESDDRDNLYAPPRAGVDRYATGWGGDDPEAEAFRREHVASEAYIKAVGLLHFVLAPLFASETLWMTSLLILDQLRIVSAPWVYFPFHLMETMLAFVAMVLTIVVGVGLRRLRIWAPGALMAMTLIFLGHAGLAGAWDLSRGQFDSAFTALVAMTMYVIAVNFAWAPAYAVVFTPEYTEAIVRTPNVRVRSRVPGRIKLYLALVLLAAIILGVVLSRLV